MGQRLGLYEVALNIAPVAKTRWKSICTDCAGAIDSLVELLQGRFSKGVMERICRQGQGLFPSPAEIQLSCNCPDYAGMCKHVAAVLYGVGARFDHQPELLFRLRGVDENDLILRAGTSMPLSPNGPDAAKVLGGEDLAGIFGLDMAADTVAEPKTRKKPAAKAAPRKRAAAKRPPKSKKTP